MNSPHNDLEEICFTRFERKLCPQVNNNVLKYSKKCLIQCNVLKLLF